jgi:hypothetical protein
MQDVIIQDFVYFAWGDLQGTREHFTGSVGPQVAAKHVTEIVDVFKLFFNWKFVGEIVEERKQIYRAVFTGV